MLKNRVNSAGFTLIEVLVALVVLAVAASGAARVISDAYRHLELTEQYQRAHYLADSHLRSLTQQQLRSGISNGVYAETGGEPPLPWRLSLEQLGIEDLPETNSDINKQVKALRAELSVELPGQDRNILLSTLLYAAPDQAVFSSEAEFGSSERR